MFCPQCGQENEPGAVFCSHCGYRLQAPELKRENRNFFIWVLIAVLVVALGTGLYFLISSFLLSPPSTSMNLSQLVPGNSGLYLSFTSTQGSLLEFLNSLQTPWPLSGTENPFKELESDPLAKELLSQIKPNVQLALAWNKENPDFYLVGEVKDQTQAEKLLTQFIDQSEKQGKTVEKKTVGNNSLVGFPEEKVWLSLKDSYIYASSFEEGLISLFKENPSSLENSSLFRSIKEQVPQNSSLFLFVNFSQIPDIPAEVSYFYLYSDEKEAHPHYKGQLALDLKKLLSNPPNKELKGVFGVILNLVSSNPETETPFQVTPLDSAFALTTFGWLGDLLNSVGSTSFIPFSSFDLSFLNGKMELFSTPDDSEAQYPFGLAFQLDQSSYSKAEQFLKQLEQLLSQSSGEGLYFQTLDIEGILSREISTPQGNFYYALTDQHLFMGTSSNCLTGLIRREKGLEKALADDEQFQHYASLLGKYHLFLYLNGEGLRQLVDKLGITDVPEALFSQVKGSSLLLFEFLPDSVQFEGLVINP